MKVRRSKERGLLAAGALVILSGFAAVGLSGGKELNALLPAAAMLLAVAVLAHACLSGLKCRGDQLFLPIAVTLSGIGLMMLFRLKPELFQAQAVWCALGIAVFTLLAVLPGRLFLKMSMYKYSWGLLTIVLVMATALFGVDIGGHRSWLILGPFRMQPSEIAKLTLVMFMAAYLCERHVVLAQTNRKVFGVSLPQLRYLAPLLAVWLMTLLMVVAQVDLGTALLFFSITLAMLYMASGKKVYVLAGAALFFLGVVVCYFGYYHIRTRVDIWLNPWADPNGRGYQIVQSLFALAAGGLLGKGFWQGRPDFIPEVHTDFIFAAIAEELGIVGSMAVFLLYLFLIIRAFRVALKSRDSFRMLAAGGLATALALQVLLIVGGISKFLPLTGITLPFVSYGGSSMIANYALLGLLTAMGDEGESS